MSNEHAVLLKHNVCNSSGTCVHVHFVSTACEKGARLTTMIAGTCVLLSNCAPPVTCSQSIMHVRHDTAPQASMLRYASGVGACRRQLLSGHFDEPPPACNAMCDACRRAAAGARAEERDVTAAACRALCVLRDWAGADKRATLLQLLDKWKPEKKKADSLTRDEAEHLLGRLLQFGCLGLSFGYTAYSTTAYFVLGAKAQGVLQGAWVYAAVYTCVVPPHAQVVCALWWRFRRARRSAWSPQQAARCCDVSWYFSLITKIPACRHV